MKERPEVEVDDDDFGQLVSQIEVVEHKIEVEDDVDEAASKKDKKKKKREKERIESMVDVVEAKPEVDDESPPAMTSEKEKKKHKKDKKKTDLVQIKPDPDGPSQVGPVQPNLPQLPKPVISAAAAAIVVKQEPGVTKKSREANRLEAQRQQLIADMLTSKPKKSKKQTETEPEPSKKEKRKKDGNVTMVVDGDPSFLVPTSTPVPRVEESRDLLITNMMAKFNKKSKKLNKQ